MGSTKDLAQATGSSKPNSFVFFASGKGKNVNGIKEALEKAEEFIK